MGFGASVLQRLVKTDIKKNLYYEIKDKVMEERYNGIKMTRNTVKVKVYGLDSTKDIRARLIEILYERVNYHKDKFIAPIILHEMEQMEVKKNGKVEHSSVSHDDQVFSYLMALYVWYDGQNLMERYNIMKNSIRTDEDLEEAVISLEDMCKDNTVEIDLSDVVDDTEDNKLKDVIDLIEESNKQKSYSDFEKLQYEEDQKALQQLLQFPPARDAYIKKYNIDPTDLSLGGLINNAEMNKGIPDSFFIDLSDEKEYSIYQGNLGNQFMNIGDDFR